MRSSWLRMTGREICLRVNVDKISTEEFEKKAPFHLTKIPWTENGYYYEEQDRPARHPFYYAGLYYLQEPSAMTPASRLVSQPETGYWICAPLRVARQRNWEPVFMGSGVLVANDISASRAKALLKNVEVLQLQFLYCERGSGEAGRKFSGIFFRKFCGTHRVLEK